MATNNKGEFLLGMLVGASVGAALALLYAPASGEETRGQVRSAADDVRNRAGDLASNVRERVPDVASQVRDRVSSVGDLAGQVRGKASDVASTVSSTVQNLTNRGGGGQGGDLPDTETGDQTGPRDQHELQTSDDPDVVADRINNAMQGSGPEAHEIAEQLAQSPTGDKG